MDTDEKTTAQLIFALGNDYEHFHEEIIQRNDEGESDEEGNIVTDFQFEARQLIRTAFAYIEAVTFSAKLTAVKICLDNNISVTPAERYFAAEVQYYLNDKGEVIEKPAQIRLSQNVRFMMRMLEKSQNNKPLFDPSEEWWSCFKRAIKVRDRLTHPREPTDLEISTNELLDTMKAKHGFDKTIMRHQSEA